MYFARRPRGALTEVGLNLKSQAPQGFQQLQQRFPQALLGAVAVERFCHEPSIAFQARGLRGLRLGPAGFFLLKQLQGDRKQKLHFHSII